MIGFGCLPTAHSKISLLLRSQTKMVSFAAAAAADDDDEEEDEEQDEDEEDDDDDGWHIGNPEIFAC